MQNIALSKLVITYLSLLLLHACCYVHCEEDEQEDDEYNVSDVRQPSVHYSSYSSELPKNVENAVLTFPLQHFISEGHHNALQGNFKASTDINEIPDEVLQSIIQHIIANNKKVFQISVVNTRSTNSPNTRQYGPQLIAFDRPMYANNDGYLGKGLKHFAAFVTQLKGGKNKVSHRRPAMYSSANRKQIQTKRANSNSHHHNNHRNTNANADAYNGDMFKIISQPIFGYPKSNVQTVKNAVIAEPIDLYDLLTSLPLYEAPIDEAEKVHVFDANYLK